GLYGGAGRGKVPRRAQSLLSEVPWKRSGGHNRSLMLRATLLKLSESPKFANWVTTNATTRKMSRRFVAGETLDDAIAAAWDCQRMGMMSSLDYLGENVATVADAQKARDSYLEIFDRIAEEG